MSKHNKKRNIGIIYEQLIQSLSKAIVAGDNDRVNCVKDIIKEHFKPRTQLYREFRLFQALVKTTASSDSLATRILGEAKTASRHFNKRELEIEKSILIKAINHRLDDPNFYSQPIKEYRDYATIQTLLNDWRLGSNGDVGRIVKYEAAVHSMLLQEKVEDDISKHENAEVNKLTVRLMLEKFNTKYGSVLNDEQVSIIESYVFSSQGEMIDYLGKMKSVTVKELQKFKSSCKNKVLLEKVDQVKRNIGSLNENLINDDNISRFLLLSKLKEEILEEKDER